MATSEEIRSALKNVRDPELGYNIVDLGLIYDVATDAAGNATITMTLTSPGCPLGDTIEKDVRDQLRLIPGIREITVNITFSPPWSPSKASEDLKREFTLLGIPIT